MAFTSLSPSTGLLFLESDLPDACHAVFTSGSLCLQCPLLWGPKRVAAPWRVLVPGPESLRRFLKDLRPFRSGDSVSVHLQRYRESRRMTRRQRQALDTALRLGFFSCPRRGGLAEVARALGISRATASEILRRAQANLLQERSPLL